MTWHEKLDSRFAQHRLRYLLVLCDGIHEFCRELASCIPQDGADGCFALQFLDSCKHANLETSDRSVGVEYHVNCADNVCKSRWKLEKSQKGLCRLRDFVNSCGPFGLRVTIVHGDCASCAAGDRTPCSCPSGLCSRL